MAAKKLGESTNICFKQLVNSTFGANTGDHHYIPDLQGVECSSDRGYMTVFLAFEYLLAAGAIAKISPHDINKATVSGMS